MEKNLKKNITLFETIIYTLSVIIGAGIFVLVGLATQVAGNATWLSFIIAAIVASFTGLSYAELSSRYPTDSAEYTYSENAFNKKWFSFGLGFLKVFVMISAISVIALGFGEYFLILFNLPILVGALIILILSFLINLYSVKGTMKFATVFVILTILGLLAIIFSGIGSIGTVNVFEFTFGFNGIISAAALIFFAFLGFEDVSSLSEESKNPKKNIPKAIIISLVIASVLYALVCLVAVNVIPFSQMTNSAITQVANITLGNLGGIILSIIALAATGSTVLIMIFSSSRMIFGMSEKKALPEIFTKVSKNNTPYISLIVVILFVLFFVILSQLKFITEITDFGSLLIFFLVNLSLIIIRFKDKNKLKIKNYFRVPLNIGHLPILATLGCIFTFIFLLEFNIVIGFITLSIMFIGILIYFLREKHIFRHIKIIKNK
ncbi:MAG: amino acid permease [Candidatus ainarchaeum sp.]|nr:amino acid permease [Candidatus ainarchaeum sp.]MDD3976049.1 amino acid permease [Candidatus ainarchaeum sp.]